MRVLAYRLVVTHQCSVISEEAVNSESAKDSAHYPISLIIAAKHGISSSIGPRASRPSDCFNGRIDSDQWDSIFAKPPNCPENLRKWFL
jgi:hypothetical protein